jgi:hypothetical protein
MVHYLYLLHEGRNFGHRGIILFYDASKCNAKVTKFESYNNVMSPLDFESQ